MSSTNITIREVAALAGVSTATVSRVMRGEQYVAEATRKAVEAAVQTLNYEPMQSARNLPSAIAKVIGLVVPHSGADMTLKNGYEYLSALHLGAMQICAARDYGLMLLGVSDASSTQRLVRLAKTRQVGGYIVAAPATDIPGLLPTLREHKVAHASISSAVTEASALWVAADERSASRDLAAHLISQGHKSIAFVGGGQVVRALQERLAGHKEALKAAGLKVRKEWILLPGITFFAGLEAGRQLLNQPWVPSAVQCETDDLAAGVIAAAHELGMRLPDDLSVVGFDNFGLAHKLSPALTTAHLPVEEMATHAANQVIGALEGVPVENQILPCEIHLRQSVRKTTPKA
jgi:LacI family transcriptional regulator